MIDFVSIGDLFGGAKDSIIDGVSGAVPDSLDPSQIVENLPVDGAIDQVTQLGEQATDTIRDLGNSIPGL